MSDLSLPMRTRCLTLIRSHSSDFKILITAVVVDMSRNFWRYHHFVQQQIKKRRRGKKVKIQFPKDVLKSGKYQNMLHNKVGEIYKERTWLSCPAGHSSWTLVSAFFSWVCQLADKVGKSQFLQCSSSWNHQSSSSWPRDREGKPPTPASWSDENAWLPFYAGFLFFIWKERNKVFLHFLLTSVPCVRSSLHGA